MEALSAPRPAVPAGVETRSAASVRAVPLGAVVLLAAGLRFASFGNVQPNPFYDAAVRSMSQSWHNFFFGAFEPGASVSIDKAPLDLWLQVLSVKLFGFNSVALRLPEALAGTVAVVLLYDVVRRLSGRTAGLAAAAGLAVLPVAVLTSRSDTMDSVLLALIMAAAWLVVRAAERDSIGPLLGAGAVLGIAFNVKLFEALVPVPALVVLYLMAADAPVRTRLVRLAAGGALFVVLALSWVTAASLAPGAKPFPIGSTNGSVWN